MQTPDLFRAALKRLLRASMDQQDITVPDLIAGTGHNLRTVGNATSYGIVETADLLDICRALDLDISAVIAEAANHENGGADIRALRAGPWQIGVAPPTDRILEIHLEGANLLGHYLADRDGWLIGHDTLIPAQRVTRWREARPDQLDRLDQALAESPQWQAPAAAEQPSTASAR